MQPGFINADFAILRIGFQRAAGGDEGERPLPFRVAQRCVGVGAAHFRQHRVRMETAAERDGDEMLHEQIHRLHHGLARLDAPCLECFASGGKFDEFERIRRHAKNATDCAGLMPAAACALEEPRDSFRTADLHHLLHRREVNAEIQTRGAHHDF